LIYTDHHVHTRFSPDSSADIESYLLRAKALGLTSVMFTDHADFGTGDELFKDLIDYEGYFNHMKTLEKAYGIPIRVGVEVGYEKNHRGAIDEFLHRFDFDFVIASIHYGDGMDFYLGDFFYGKTQEEAYYRYFEILLEMVENFTNYEVVGHLDYITRYGPFEQKKYRYRDFKEIIDEILKGIIARQRGIEVNTSGLRGLLGVTFPGEEVLRRYLELGGRTITIGSDAHFNEDYYAGVLDEVDRLKALGYTGISAFEKRKEKFYPIEFKRKSLGYE